MKNKAISIVKFTGFKTILGLMFKIPKKNTIYFFDLKKEGYYDIHTFFCLKSLDIYILDENFKIVKAYKNVKPFKIILPKIRFRYFIETLAGEFNFKEGHNLRKYILNINNDK